MAALKPCRKAVHVEFILCIAQHFPLPLLHAAEVYQVTGAMA